MHRDPEGVISKLCDPFRVAMDGSTITGALPPPIEFGRFQRLQLFLKQLLTTGYWLLTTAFS
jgi:hypothetical protein